MGNHETRKKLIEATKRLLTGGAPPDALTVRQISSEAKVNLAMVNYCFKSKDELLKIAVDEIVAEEFALHSHPSDVRQTAKEQLRELLSHVCAAMIKYRALTQLSIPYLMLNDDITLPLDLLPFVKAHYGADRSETECRVIAFQIVYNLQLIFYRAEDFRRYSGIDITDEKQMLALLASQLDLYLTQK